MNKVIYRDKKIIELIKGNSGKAIYITAIGKKFKNLFINYSYNYFKNYCNRYDIGLIILYDYIIDKKKLIYPFNSYPHLQRLFIPEEIKKYYPKYKYLADIDADCLPTSISRNIFDYALFNNENEKKIYLVEPRPQSFSKSQIGKRMSLLRKLFLNKKFPLNSILSADDEDLKKIFKLNYEGHMATIGTCVAPTNILVKKCKSIISKIRKNPRKYVYLQHYTNTMFRLGMNVCWLPYEFQAIWSHEVALNYPFLLKDIKNYSLFNLCIKATMSKVDMLHFAGSWPENNVFYNKVFFKTNDALENYYSNLPKLLKKKLKIKSYGKIKYK